MSTKQTVYVLCSYITQDDCTIEAVYMTEGEAKNGKDYIEEQSMDYDSSFSHVSYCTITPTTLINSNLAN